MREKNTDQYGTKGTPEEALEMMEKGKKISHAMIYTFYSSLAQ